MLAVGGEGRGGEGRGGEGCMGYSLRGRHPLNTPDVISSTCWREEIPVRR